MTKTSYFGHCLLVQDLHQFLGVDDVAVNIVEKFQCVVPQAKGSGLGLLLAGSQGVLFSIVTDSYCLWQRKPA